MTMLTLSEGRSLAVERTGNSIKLCLGGVEVCFCGEAELNKMKSVFAGWREMASNTNGGSVTVKTNPYTATVTISDGERWTTCVANRNPFDRFVGALVDDITDALVAPARSLIEDPTV